MLYLGDCLDFLARMEPDSIDLTITSPPYWNQRDYSHWNLYDNYLAFINAVVYHLRRVTKPGRHVFWVIPDKLPYPPRENGGTERLYLPIYADTEGIAARVGLVPEFPIIWKKPHGTRKMFGSYPYPPTTIHTPMTERICVWRKPGKPALPADKTPSAYTKEQWVGWAQDLWEIAPETSGIHPAAFPEEIPRRIITLWSFVNDTVLDPFMGSGTTCVVAKRLNRSYVGIEENSSFFAIAQDRVLAGNV